ncbi:MAG TPA: response regulator [Pseudomonadota bacterium]|nr:response regulator [Pseudomonadota bacterium]
MPTLLIIEDEIDLQQVLEYNLRRAGHEVLCASTGKAGLQLVAERSPQLILLDLMLPDISGTQVCRALKAEPRTAAIPVIMLTARGEEADRIVGFELGADDYVVKPFSIRELMLRIGVSLRRGTATAESPGVIEFGCLRIDCSAHRVFVQEQEVRLTALEFKLLRKLYEAKDQVQTRATLLGHVWQIEADVTTRTVDTHIKRLREKIGAAGGYIETVRGVGYRFAPLPEGQSP